MHRDKSEKMAIWQKIATLPFCLRPYPGLSCAYLGGSIELFQDSLSGFQKFFLFWVAGIILEAWDVELERAHSFMFQFCFQAVSRVLEDFFFNQELYFVAKRCSKCERKEKRKKVITNQMCMKNPYMKNEKCWTFHSHLPNNRFTRLFFFLVFRPTYMALLGTASLYIR